MCLVACGGISKKSKEQISAPEIDSKANLGLALTGVDLYYSSSDLYFYDYGSGLISGVLYGQSGDSAIWWLDHKLTLFNRTPTRHNYIRFEGRSADTLRPSREIGGPFAKGDPSDVIVLDNGHWLLSYFGMGKVSEIDPETGKELQDPEFVFDGPFHPSSMLKVKVDGVSYIFIANLGIEVDPVNYKTIANGNQGLYLVREEDSGLKVLNNGKPIATPLASNPGFYHTSEARPMLAGLCYAGTKNCTQAIESLNVEKAINGATEEEVLAKMRLLDDADFSMNGRICDGFDPNTIYANVVFNKDRAPFVKGGKYLIRINASEQLDPGLVHHYAHPDSSGSYLLLPDKSIDTLYFGDIGADRKASLNIFRNGHTKAIPMQRIPYYGALIQK